MINKTFHIFDAYPLLLFLFVIALAMSTAIFFFTEILPIIVGKIIVAWTRRQSKKAQERMGK